MDCGRSRVDERGISIDLCEELRKTVFEEQVKRFEQLAGGPGRACRAVIKRLLETGATSRPRTSPRKPGPGPSRTPLAASRPDLCDALLRDRLRQAARRYPQTARQSRASSTLHSTPERAGTPRSPARRPDRVAAAPRDSSREPKRAPRGRTETERLGASPTRSKGSRLLQASERKLPLAKSTLDPSPPKASQPCLANPPRKEACLQKPAPPTQTPKQARRSPENPRQFPQQKSKIKLRLEARDTVSADLLSFSRILPLRSTGQASAPQRAAPANGSAPEDLQLESCYRQLIKRTSELFRELYGE